MRQPKEREGMTDDSRTYRRLKRRHLRCPL